MLLSWGKPSIFVRSKDTIGAIWRKLATPKEDTTQFEEAEGDELEAKEEGGDVVDSMVKNGGATLTMDEFTKKGGKLPFAAKGGKINDHYEVYVQPEDPDGVGVYIPHVSGKQITKMNAADGMLQTITLKAIKEAGKDLFTIGTVNVTGTAGSYNISITPLEATSETEAEDESESAPTA